MTREEAIKELSYIADEMPSMECGDWKEAIQMAIKSLEKEPCDDAISRKKVIDTIYCECSCENIDIDFAKVLLLQRAIKALPPVTPQPKMGQWIPVSERLPELGQRVIATVESIDGNYVRETICGKYGLLCGNGIAWMPLPQPYKAESEVHDADSN